MASQDDAITVLPSAYEKKPRESVDPAESEESSIESFVERPEPTDDDLARLRRVSETIPMRAWYRPYFINLIRG